jgi:hypothetical protein
MLESKYVIQKNLNIGLRVAGTGIIRDADFFIFITLKTTERYVYSFLVTCNYYFVNGKILFHFLEGE